MKMEATPKMADDDDYEFDEVMGEHGKKSKLSGLNKKKLSSEEMDEIFL